MARFTYYRPAQRKLSKHYIKFLSSIKDPKLTRVILLNAPPSVIKGISNAALNVQNNPGVRLSPQQKKLFRQAPVVFEALVDKTVTIPSKRKLLVSQKGGALPLIPIILSAALGALGSLFLPK